MQTNCRLELVFKNVDCHTGDNIINPAKLQKVYSDYENAKSHDTF